MERGGGHEVAKSAANVRPAVCSKHGGRCAVRRSGRDERVVAPQAGRRASTAERDCTQILSAYLQGWRAFPQGIFKG